MIEDDPFTRGRFQRIGTDAGILREYAENSVFRQPAQRLRLQRGRG